MLWVGWTVVSLLSLRPRLIPGKSVWNLWCAKWDVFSQYFGFPLSVSVHHCSIPFRPSTTQDVECLSPCASVFPCQYHSTIDLYSFIHLPRMLYTAFLPVLQFSPVSIIPPLLHTHSSIYRACCIMFFSQHFSFPLSVSFCHCSIPIHPSTTHAV